MWLSQDPLMRRIEGSQILPAGAVIHHRFHSISILLIISTCLHHHRPPTGKRNLFTAWINDFQFQAKKIDIFSRWIFPFTFLMFNIWYWSYYLSQAQSKAKKREESWTRLTSWPKTQNPNQLEQSNIKKYDVHFNQTPCPWFNQTHF